MAYAATSPSFSHHPSGPSATLYCSPGAVAEPDQWIGAMACPTGRPADALGKAGAALQSSATGHPRQGTLRHPDRLTDIESPHRTES